MLKLDHRAARAVRAPRSAHARIRKPCVQPQPSQFEQRLSSEFHLYCQDVPQGAFPSFLETLYCESLK